LLTPHGDLAACIVRFWNGSGVLEVVHETGESGASIGSLTRIERRRFSDLPALVFRYLQFIVPSLDPSAPDPD